MEMLREIVDECKKDKLLRIMFFFLIVYAMIYGIFYYAKVILG